MYKITGKTYDAREGLKAAGYKYNKDIGGWVGESRDAFDALMAKWSRPAYGRQYNRMASQLFIEQI